MIENRPDRFSPAGEELIKLRKYLLKQEWLTANEVISLRFYPLIRHSAVKKWAESGKLKARVKQGPGQARIWVKPEDLIQFIVDWECCG